MQDASVFHSCKNNNFQMKNCDNVLIFAQNIEYGYTHAAHRNVFVVIQEIFIIICCRLM